MKKLLLLPLLSLILMGCSLQDLRNFLIPEDPTFQDRPTIVSLGTTIPELGEFIIISDSSCIADIKLRLLQVGDETITLEAIEDADETGAFIPRDITKQVVVDGEECVKASILCGNQTYNYCFTLNLDSDPIELLSEIK